MTVRKFVRHAQYDAPVPVLAVLPLTQYWPATTVQGPEHVDAVCPVALPKYPVAHKPEHASVERPAVLPKLPRGHAVLSFAPPWHQLPGGQRTPLVELLPAGQ
jgi:hypothetical protein